MGFVHLPNEQAWRQSATYHQIFAMTLLWNVGIAGIIVFVLFLVCLMLKLYQIKNKKESTHKIRDSLLSEQTRQASQRVSGGQAQGNSSENINSEELIESFNKVENPDTKRFKVSNFLTSFFYYCLWVDIALIYLVFYMFGFMGRGLSHDILSIFVMTLIVLIPTLIWKNKTKINKFKFVKKEIIFTGVCLALWLGVNIFAVLTLKGACLCYYNDHYGVTLGDEQGPYLSTEWTRSNNIDQICKDSELCNLYATVPLNTESQVFINMHTGLDIEKMVVRLTGPNNKTLQNTVTDYLNMTNVEEIGRRHVFSTLFSNLIADTTYKVEVYSVIIQTPELPKSNIATNTPKETLKLSKSTKYKTTPSKETDQLRLAVGGDISMTIEGLLLTEQLISYDPDIIIIGGDNSYDDGMRTCYYSWDNFYEIFDDLNQKAGRLIPLVMSVGNHDVGFDALSTASINRDIEDIPLYFLYNPQHLSPDESLGVPNFDERSTVHTHIVGPTVHLHLDSGYLENFQTQTSEIKFTGNNYSDYHLFANYHNPIYPSCTNSLPGSNDLNVITHALKFWTPLFDEFNFVAGFEHHTHHKKFTNKLRNNTVVDDSKEGMRFVGDGSWGVVEGSCSEGRKTPTPEKIKFSDLEKPNHLWLVTLNLQKDKSYTINYTAIDEHGRANFTQIDALPQL